MIEHSTHNHDLENFFNHIIHCKNAMNTTAIKKIEKKRQKNFK